MLEIFSTLRVETSSDTLAIFSQVHKDSVSNLLVFKNLQM